MADGTVRGTFDLNTGPAKRAVADYRREAARADEQTRRLGSSIDSAFNERQAAQIERVQSNTRGLATTTSDTRRVVRDEWRGMRRDIQKEAAQIVSTIAVVRDRLRALGRERTRIAIDVAGVDAALAKVELLHNRLAALGRQRATPRVGVGGGGFGSAGARAAAGAAGGGSSRGGGLLDFGRIGIQPRNLLYAGAAAYAQPLIGGATALGGSLTGAALGAGATGLAGGAALGAGVLGTALVAKPAMNALKEATKLQQAYTRAVVLHGRNSKQAAQAQMLLDRAFRGQPGLRAATLQLRAFSREWKTLTAPGRRQFFGGIADVTRIGRRAAPNIAANANLATGAVRGAATHQASFLAGRTMQDTLSFFTRSFARELPTAERTLENVELTIVRIARASMPFFHDANVWVRNWTYGWRQGTRDIEGTRAKIRPMVQSFKDWRDLTGAVFHTVRDLFQLGAPAGDSMVVHLTRSFDRWDAWIQSNPAKIRSFFTDSVSSVEKLAGALGGVVHWLNSMATLLRPIVDNFSTLVQAASSLGLVGAPGLAAAGFGAFRSVRGGGRGGGGGGAAGGGGMGSMGLAAVGLGAAGIGGRAAARGAGGTLGRLIPTAAGMATAPGFRGGILQGGATRAYGMSRALGPARTLATGALRGYGPIAGLFAGAQFAATPGTLTERLQSAASSATLGAVPMPVTGAQARQQGYDTAARNISNLGQANTVGDIRGQIARLQAAQTRAQGRAHVTQSRGLFGGVGTLGLFDPGRGGDRGPTTPQARASAAQAGAYGKQIEGLVQQERALLRVRNARLDSQSRQRATQYGAGLGGAYQAYRRGGQSQTQAAGSTVDQIKGRLSSIRAAGVETLGEAGLSWANELAKHNPKIKKQVEELTDAIRHRFKKLGKDVQIVNGNILTGSKSEWAGIRDAMAGPMEQARQKLSADFTSIQQQAVGALRAMGFSKSEASALVRGSESAQGRSNLQAATGLMAAGGAGNTQAARNIPGAVALGNKKARGGVIGGQGLLDTVGVGGGASAAPGETWIANRHTMSQLTAATLAKFGKTAQQMIGGETRRHSAPMQPRGGIMAGLQRGGRVPGMAMDPSGAGTVSTAAGGGGGLAGMMGMARRINAAHYPYRWGGGHDANFTAPYDCSGAVSSVLHAGGYLNAPLTSGALMSWGDPGPGAVSIYSTTGHTYMNLAGQWFGTSTQNPGGGAGFFNGAPRPGFVVRHVPGLGGGGAMSNLAGGGGGAGGGMSVAVHGLGRQQAGLAGVLRGRAGDIYASGLQSKLNAGLAGAGGLGAVGGGGNARALGRSMMLAAGWPGSEWNALNSLWTRESGWNPNAVNKSSGAMGIPQALGHGNVFALGNAGPQIQWGLNYIRGKYGSPSAAWAHEQSAGWYARGGRVKYAGGFAKGGSFLTNGPTMFMAGEGGQRERVNVTPHGKGGGGVNVTFGKGSVVVGSGAEAGEEVVKKIIEAIDKGLSGVVD